MPIQPPDTRNPLILPDGTPQDATVYLAAVVEHPNIEIGAYTYAHDARLTENWAETLAPYLYPGAPERLSIGKFCQIAQGVQFITESANHDMDGLSTYPFAVFDPARFEHYRKTQSRRRDTIIGSDCWLGREATILPGAQIGDGVIVGARAVVGGDVPDYAVVAGNPGRVLHMRFSASEISRLKALSWWDWPIEQIEAAIPAIEGGDLDALEAVRKRAAI